MATMIYLVLVLVLTGITALAAIFLRTKSLVSGTAHLSPSRAGSIGSRRKPARMSSESGVSLLETAVIVGTICTIALVAIPVMGKIAPETICKALPAFSGDRHAFPFDDPLYFDQESGEWWCPVEHLDENNQQTFIDAFTGTLID